MIDKIICNAIGRSRPYIAIRHPINAAIHSPIFPAALVYHCIFLLSSSLFNARSESYKSAISVPETKVNHIAKTISAQARSQNPGAYRYPIRPSNIHIAQIISHCFLVSISPRYQVGTSRRTTAQAKMLCNRNTSVILSQRLSKNRTMTGIIKSALRSNLSIPNNHIFLCNL